jgi:hypothetical protein
LDKRRFLLNIKIKEKRSTKGANAKPQNLNASQATVVQERQHRQRKIYHRQRPALPQERKTLTFERLGKRSRQKGSTDKEKPTTDKDLHHHR